MQQINKQVGLAQYPAFPFQFQTPHGIMAQTGITFRHLAAIHIMAGFAANPKQTHNGADVVAMEAVLGANALAAELDRTESMGGPHVASEDTVLLDHMEKFLARVCRVNGGAEDGKEGKAFVIAGDQAWSLRDMLRSHKADVDAGQTPPDTTPGGVVIKDGGAQ